MWTGGSLTSKTLKLTRSPAPVANHLSNFPRRAWPLNSGRFAQKRAKVESLRYHGERAIRVARPLRLGSIAIEFQAVAIGIAQVERFTDSVIAGAVERDLGFSKPFQG